MGRPKRSLSLRLFSGYLQDLAPYTECRLPGFIGPVPPPLSISLYLVFSWSPVLQVYFSYRRLSTTVSAKMQESPEKAHLFWWAFLSKMPAWRGA